mgnify:CR=1 FL=1
MRILSDTMPVKDSPRELWEYVLTQVELSISPANFNTWFRDSSIVRVEDGIVSPHRLTSPALWLLHAHARPQR